jgi:hypothetical protein
VSTLRKLLSTAASAAAVVSVTALAVPTSFLLSPSGNQRDANWKTIESKKFRIYHEDSAADLGKLAIESTETAWPYLSYILGIRLPEETSRFAPRENEQVSRFPIIPIIVNARNDIGGFANLATQNIEIQIQSGTKSSLFQHELTHRIMYDRIDPNFGPAGRLFTTAMLPTWWIEGLAEHLTESVGRWESQGIERTMAMQNKWPTWDSLHNLYNSPGDYGKGYVTSGRFFTYLRSLVPQKTITELHDSLFWKTLTPPFATAEYLMLKKHWGKNGPELYKDFQKSKSDYWNQELSGLPPLMASAKIVTSRLGTPAIVALENKKVFISSLAEEPNKSAFIFLDTKNREQIRKPVSIEGSLLFAIAPGEQSNGMFWTTTHINFPNHASGSELHAFEFQGSLENLESDQLKKRASFALSTAKDPVVITDILATSKGKAFVLGSVRGNFTLYYIDVETNSVIKRHQWTSPTDARFAKRSKPFLTGAVNCASLVVDYDFERTALERFCMDGTESVVLPQGQLLVRSAIEQNDNEYLLQFAWKSASGLAELKNGKIARAFPFSEWADTLVPMNDNSNALWVFNGDGYNLVEFSFHQSYDKWKQWSLGIIDNSQWKSIPQWHQLVPPFVTLAENERKLLESSPPPKPNPAAAQEQGANADTIRTVTDAPYRNRHFFSYPTLIPPYFGGWAIGLASIPWMDEMERHRLEIYADYAAGSNSPSGRVSYVNNRLFDAMTISVLSQAKFNGIYYSQKYRARYYNYLRENGAEISTTHLSTARTTISDLGLRISRINPMYILETEQEINAAGAQKGVLATASAAISTIVGEKSFYAGRLSEPNLESILWRTAIGATAETTHSIGKSYNYASVSIPQINFQRYRISGKSSLSLNEKTFSLRGEVGGTTGSSTLNLREYFQPYRTYLQGTGMSLNALNFSLIDQGGLLSTYTGTYSFRTSMDYTFPIWRDIDYQWLILYFESLRGEFEVGRGGISSRDNFSDFRLYDTATFALRTTINVKGFQLFPSVAYAQLLNNHKWAIFSEISFSQFF